MNAWRTPLVLVAAAMLLAAVGMADVRSGGRALPPLSGGRPRSLAFTHVTVVDVTAREPARALEPDRTVVVTGNRIAAVGPSGRVRVPDGAEVVDASGKFLI